MADNERNAKKHKSFNESKVVGSSIDFDTFYTNGGITTQKQLPGFTKEKIPDITNTGNLGFVDEDFEFVPKGTNVIEENYIDMEYRRFAQIKDSDLWIPIAKDSRKAPQLSNLKHVKLGVSGSIDENNVQIVLTQEQLSNPEVQEQLRNLAKMGFTPKVTGVGFT